MIKKIENYKQKVLSELYNYKNSFKDGSRNGYDGLSIRITESYKTINDNVPEVLNPLNDCSYAWFENAIIHLIDDLENEDFNDYEELKDVLGNCGDSISEFADANVDIYDGTLTAWLADSSYNRCLVDEAISEFGNPGDIIKSIQLGQYKGLEDMAYTVVEFIKKVGENDAEREE